MTKNNSSPVKSLAKIYIECKRLPIGRIKRDRPWWDELDSIIKTVEEHYGANTVNNTRPEMQSTNEFVKNLHNVLSSLQSFLH